MQVKNYKEFLNEVYAEDITKSSTPKRKERSKRVKVTFEKASRNSKIAYFKAKDPKGSGKQYQTSVQLEEHSGLSKDLSQQERVKLALEAGDVKIFCNCPDFLYGGYKYIAYQMDFGIRKENIRPNKKNPNLEGTGCKHIIATVENIQKFVPQIAKGFSYKK